MSVSTTRTHIRMHHINSIHTCSMLASNTHASYQQPSLLLICFCFQQLQTNPPSTPLFLLVLSFSHNHPLPSLLAVCSFFLGFAFSSLDVHCRNKITGHRGAWHFRLEKAQKLSSHACSISIRKELSLGRRPSKWRSQAGNWQASQAGTGKHAQAGHWQTFPGRELAKRPRQGLQNMPRQGTGKRSQAGNWQAFPGRKLASVPRQGTGKRPRQGLQACPGRACTLASVPRQGTGKRPRQGLQACPGRACTLASVPRQGTGKRSQAGNWQAFPGRELASVPRQGTGKRSQAGNWQASQAGTANVPRQGTGKCSQAGNRRRPQAGDSGCSHAGNCRHCKSLATICHQPRGATPPPTSCVLCDELACLLTGRGAIVNRYYVIFECLRTLRYSDTLILHNFEYFCKNYIVPV